jgi:hypothetical protein
MENRRPVKGFVLRQAFAAKLESAIVHDRRSCPFRFPLSLSSPTPRPAAVSRPFHKTTELSGVSFGRFLGVLYQTPVERSSYIFTATTIGIIWKKDDGDGDDDG